MKVRVVMLMLIAALLVSAMGFCSRRDELIGLPLYLLFLIPNGVVDSLRSIGLVAEPVGWLVFGITFAFVTAVLALAVLADRLPGRRVLQAVIVLSFFGLNVLGAHCIDGPMPWVGELLDEGTSNSP